MKKVQRACKACVANAIRIPTMACRLAQLSSQLSALSGDRFSSQYFASLSESCSLLDATQHCEAALKPLETALLESRQRAEGAEREAAMLGDLVKRVLQNLQTLPCLADELAPPPQPSGVQEFADSLDTALTVVCRELKERRRLGSWGSSTTASSGQHSSIVGSSLDGSCCIEAEGKLTPQFGKPSAKGGEVAHDLNRRCVNGEIWQEDAMNCSICLVRLGWNFFKRRHHCRLCGRCVCGNCSPNLISVKGSRRPVRVCTPCVADAPNLVAFARRTTHLGYRLAAIGGTFIGSSLQSSMRGSDVGFEQALNFCEEAVKPLEDQRRVSEASGTSLDFSDAELTLLVPGHGAQDEF